MKKKLLTLGACALVAAIAAWSSTTSEASQKASPNLATQPVAIAVSPVTTLVTATQQATIGEEELVVVQAVQVQENVVTQPVALAVHSVAKLVANEGFIAALVLDTKVATNTEAMAFVEVKSDSLVGDNFANYPNPFNAQTEVLALKISGDPATPIGPYALATPTAIGTNTNDTKLGGVLAALPSPTFSGAFSSGGFTLVGGGANGANNLGGPTNNTV